MCATGLFFKAYVKPQLTQCSIWRTFFHLRFPLSSSKAIHMALPKTKGKQLLLLLVSEAIQLAINSSEEPG